MDAKFSDVSDALWAIVQPLLPAPPRRKSKRGRPRLDNRRALAGIAYRLRTGCQWKAMPPQFGSGSGVHKRFQEWVRVGVFPQIFQAMLKHYDKARGLDLKWCSLDGAIVKAPKGGTSRVPTRRIGPSRARSGAS